MIFTVFDSWGKLPSGFLLGNIDWPGSYHQCLAIQNDSFRAQYFSLFYGAPPSPVRVLKLWKKLHYCFYLRFLFLEKSKILKGLFYH